jgi:DNA-binding transcriptional ArsR family regulator
MANTEELGELPWDGQEFALEEDEFWEMRQMFLALGNQTRLEIVELIYAGSAQVGEIALAMDLSVSLVSYHLRELQRAGLLTSERNANTKTYQLSSKGRAILKLVAVEVSRERRERAGRKT